MGVEVETITPPPNPEDKPVKGWRYSHSSEPAPKWRSRAPLEGAGGINENNHKKAQV